MKPKSLTIFILYVVALLVVLIGIIWGWSALFQKYEYPPKHEYAAYIIGIGLIVVTITGIVQQLQE